ncbi:hypothetical protein [Priestia megaterium]|uniref:hypothetical protein n=1 Tax=Priestia megaterium TaxID=1404 RepID=UPI00285C1F2B|nr:hypothetical protein [Priestia megaterium]MDR7207608.1 putative transcriptional regulator [Priestia megaterium]
MNEMELFQMFGKEGVTFLAIILVYVLFVRPKDMQMDKKDAQITELVETNRLIVAENSEQLGNISSTLEKISTEMTSLSENQKKLNDGQDELWKEIVYLKKER